MLLVAHLCVLEAAASIGPGGIEIEDIRAFPPATLPASIGPGGIEISHHGRHLLLLMALQLDRVELKYSKSAAAPTCQVGFNWTGWN